MTLIIRARRTHIALSGGDRRDDPALLVPREKVAALIEALDAVTVEVPKCEWCQEQAVQSVDIDTGFSYRCDRHRVTVEPVEPVTEVTI